jgi:putative glutamine amidotransferase
MKVALTFRFEEKAGPYRTAIRSVGLEPVDLTPTATRRTLDGLNGLILTGGTDLTPALYGEAAALETDHRTDGERDAFETLLLGEAMGRRMPLLAICRGMQLMNVAFGGTLHQHLETAGLHATKPAPAERSRPVHPVRIEAGSRLCAIAGDPVCSVNSRHHQGVKGLGCGLTVSARADDGVVEGIEYPAQPFAIGVQWHPEDSIETSVSDRLLFQAFAKAASHFNSLH